MSSSTHYYRNALGSLTYEADGFVRLTWSSAPVLDDQLQSLYAHTLQALRHHGTGKLLTDQRQRQPLPEVAQRWIAEQWIPRARVECAYSHCAIVESSQLVSRVAARAVGSSQSSPLTFQYFEQEADARHWLLTC